MRTHVQYTHSMDYGRRKRILCFFLSSSSMSCIYFSLFSVSIYFYFSHTLFNLAVDFINQLPIRLNRFSRDQKWKSHAQLLNVDTNELIHWALNSEWLTHRHWCKCTHNLFNETLFFSLVNCVFFEWMFLAWNFGLNCLWMFCGLELIYFETHCHLSSLLLLQPLQNAILTMSWSQ